MRLKINYKRKPTDIEEIVLREQDLEFSSLILKGIKKKVRGKKPL